VPNLKDYGQAVFLASKCEIAFCKKNPKLSRKINVEKTIDAISELSNKDIKIAFASSDAVFSGDKGHYTEMDEVSPNTLYGEHKVEVEQYLRDQVPDSLILRFSKNYGHYPNDRTLFSVWFQQILEDKMITCVSDQFFSPTYVEDTAKIVYELFKGNKSGLFHVSSPSRYKRMTLLQMLQSEIGVKNVKCREILTEELGITDIYAKDTSMNSEKLMSQINIEFINFDLFMQRFMAEIPASQLELLRHRTSQ
jgi:dTDP-4-dehydrorhamnose reductase